MNDRRMVRRRPINHVRSGVLLVGSRRHLVKVVDLSPEGAFIATRAEAAPDAEMFLELLLPRRSRTVRLSCRLVWRSERFDAATGHPAGMAIRFENLDADTRRMVEEYAHAGFRLAELPPVTVRYSYMTLERSNIDNEELNQLGQEGWMLAAVHSLRRDVRLVFMRPI
jgi:hypothetical protein